MMDRVMESKTLRSGSFSHVVSTKNLNIFNIKACNCLDHIQ